MNKVKKGLDNQAIGLLPLLLFMFWTTIFLISCLSSSALPFALYVFFSIRF